MKLTKLSLIATLAISAAVAGGDIAPVEPVAETPAAATSATTVNGKLTGYYYTDDSQAAYDIFEKEASQLGLAATLDVSHKLTDWMTLNFSAVGYVNTLKQPNAMYMEGNKNGAFFNVANATFNYADTTFIAGRQLVDTPMVGGFDWLLAPGAFEAYTLVNNSIENVTLVGSYLRTWRPNNTGDTWVNLTDIDDGNNWTVAAAYKKDALSASLWYYNVDAGVPAGNPDKYTQIYADAGYDFGVAQVKAQYVHTDYDVAQDSDAYGLEVSGKVANFALTAAVMNVSDNQAGYVGRDTLVTSSWNSFAGRQAIANDDTLSWKVGASTTFANIDTSISYAQYGDEGSEFDLILGYSITDNIDANLVYTDTDYDVDVDTADAVNALEIYANYKF
jgi:hypothetical protein